MFLVFKGIIDIGKNEEINFDKWKGEITKKNSKVRRQILEYFNVSLKDRPWFTFVFCRWDNRDS